VPVRCELAQLVEIQRDELLDLEDVDPVTQTHVVRQRFRDGEAALSCDEHGAMSGVEILPAPLDALGGQHSRCRDVAKSLRPRSCHSGADSHPSGPD